MKPYQINDFARAVFRDFQKIEYTEKPGSDSKIVCDVGKSDLLDGIDLNVAGFIQRIAVANLYMGSLPDSNAAGNLATADAGS